MAFRGASEPMLYSRDVGISLTGVNRSQEVGRRTKSGHFELLDVKVAVVEVGLVAHPAPVGEAQAAAVADDEAVGLERLEDAVDMDRSQSGRVGQLSYPERPVSQFSDRRTVSAPLS